MNRYAICGKEVLRNGEHFVDAGSEADARRVAMLFNLADRAARADSAVNPMSFGVELAALGER